MAKSAAQIKAEAKRNQMMKTAEGSRVKKLIGIVSGKGGVGKSLVSGLITSAMRKEGYSVGLIDADITGPSIPKMFGSEHITKATEHGMLPSVTESGIKIMSLNLLMQEDTEPVIWRGPILGQVVQQFWSEVDWGDIDVMFLDMPPGTGDVPLTIYQTLPVDGIVIVTTPQDLVGMIVEKAVHMAEMMEIPVLGVVENMSYLKCPHCSEEIPVFGISNVEQRATHLGTAVAGRLPIDPSFAAKCDSGQVEEIDTSYLAPLVTKIKEMLSQG
ncbi:MAG: Mrp/NBP35 family ATP-binding protein [Lachnospiraceae bacterium]|nr:Mrp/NBP35 family ATP-binding protein [Lachnospiraceae bacterium]